MIGTVPNPDLARALFTSLVPRPVSGWHSLPPSVSVATARTRDGRRLHVLHNWSWAPAEVTAPAGHQGLQTSLTYRAGRRVQLGRWEVKVFLDDVTERSAGETPQKDIGAEFEAQA
jgi:beta-galactosidase